MSLRKTISLSSLLCFIALMLTSVILYIEPAGRVAYWSGWKLWLLNKEQWGALHLNFGVLLFILMLLHLWLNLGALLSYLRNRLKRLHLLSPDSMTALVLTLLVGIGTLAELPPFSSVVNFGSQLSDTANLRYGEPPYGHAELSPLAVFAERVKINLATAQQRLKEAGFSANDSKETLKEIAARYNVTPQQLYLAIQPPIPAQDKQTLPDEPPGGTGKRTLEQICAAYQLDLANMRYALTSAGIRLSPGQTFKEIAEANHRDPHQLYALLVAAQKKQ